MEGCCSPGGKGCLLAFTFLCETGALSTWLGSGERCVLLHSLSAVLFAVPGLSACILAVIPDPFSTLQSGDWKRSNAAG